MARKSDAKKKAAKKTTKKPAASKTAAAKTGAAAETGDWDPARIEDFVAGADRIDLSGIDGDGSGPEDVFRFTPPAGVRIVRVG